MPCLRWCLDDSGVTLWFNRGYLSSSNLPTWQASSWPKILANTPYATSLTDLVLANVHICTQRCPCYSHHTCWLSSDYSDFRTKVTVTRTTVFFVFLLLEPRYLSYLLQGLKIWGNGSGSWSFRPWSRSVLCFGVIDLDSNTAWNIIFDIIYI